MKYLVRSVLSGAVLLACGLSVFGRPQSRRGEIKRLSKIGPLLSSRDSTADVLQDPYNFKPVFTTPLDANLNLGGDTNSITLPGTQHLSLLPTPLDGNYDYASASPIAPTSTTPEVKSGFATQLESGSGEMTGSFVPSNSVSPSEGLVTTNGLAPSGNDDIAIVDGQITNQISPLLTDIVLIDLIHSLENLRTTKFCFWQLQGNHKKLYLSAVGDEKSQWSDFFSDLKQSSPGFGFIRTDSNDVLVIMSLFRTCEDDSYMSSEDGSCGELQVLQRIARDPIWIGTIRPIYGRVHQEGPVKDDAGLMVIGKKYIRKPAIYPRETD